jgi:hypothetical protein
MNGHFSGFVSGNVAAFLLVATAEVLLLMAVMMQTSVATGNPFSLRLVRSTLKELRELTHLTEPTDCCVSSGGVPNGVAGH